MNVLQRKHHATSLDLPRAPPLPLEMLSNVIKVIASSLAVAAVVAPLGANADGYGVS